MKVSPVSTADLGQQGQQPQQAASQSQFSNEDKHKELAREINLRQQVYPGMIRSGRLTQANADRQIAILREIWNDYGARAQEDKSRRQPQLGLGDQQGQQKDAQPSDARIDTVTGLPVGQPANSDEQRKQQSQDKPQDQQQEPGGDAKPVGEPKPGEKPAQPTAPERAPETASAVTGTTTPPPSASAKGAPRK